MKKVVSMFLCLVLALCIMVSPTSALVLNEVDALESTAVQAEEISPGVYYFEIPFSEVQGTQGRLTRDGIGMVTCRYDANTGYVELGSTTVGWDLIKWVSIDYVLSGSVPTTNIHQEESQIIPGPMIHTSGYHQVGQPYDHPVVIRITYTGLVGTVLGGGSFIGSQVFRFD